MGKKMLKTDDDEDNKEKFKKYFEFRKEDRWDDLPGKINSHHDHFSHHIISLLDKAELDIKEEALKKLKEKQTKIDEKKAEVTKTRREERKKRDGDAYEDTESEPEENLDDDYEAKMAAMTPLERQIYDANIDVEKFKKKMTEALEKDMMENEWEKMTDK